jgi:DNA-binding response OmpR family regulator
MLHVLPQGMASLATLRMGAPLLLAFGLTRITPTSGQSFEALEGATVLSAGNLRVDVGMFRAFVGERPVELTYLEFELLRLLASKPGRILSYDEIVATIWHGNVADMRRRLGVVICRLRAKTSGLAPFRIQTVRGRGYGLVAPISQGA